jgi:hypothetical protein
VRYDENRLKHVLPDANGELLLRAGIAQGPEALDAWREWYERNGLDHLDQASFRLLPLVYRNLSRQALPFEPAATLKGVYRRAWCENQILFGRIAALLAKLRSAGIPTMVLKGAAVSKLHYRDEGTRPMSDVDVLVPSKSVVAVADLLSAEQWRRTTQPGRKFDANFRRYRHAACFERRHKESVDVHWHALFMACDESVDEILWKRAVAVNMNGQASLALDPTGQLLHAVLHGFAANADIAPIRWIADAMAILRSTPAIDWAFLTDFCIAHRFHLFMAIALRYLNDAFQAPIPNDVLAKLEGVRVSPADRIEFERATFAIDPQPAIEVLRANYRRHWRCTRGMNPAVRMLFFPDFLKHYWRKDSVFEVGWMAVRYFLWRLSGSPVSPFPVYDE